MPTPRFYVLYYGSEDQEDQELRLSNAYKGEEGLKVGLAEGHAEAKFEDVDALVSKGVLDATSACEVLGVPLEDYERYKQS